MNRFLLLYDIFYDFSTFLLGPMMINAWRINWIPPCTEGGRLQKIYRVIFFSWQVWTPFLVVQVSLRGRLLKESPTNDFQFKMFAVPSSDTERAAAVARACLRCCGAHVHKMAQPSHGPSVFCEEIVVAQLPMQALCTRKKEIKRGNKSAWKI